MTKSSANRLLTLALDYRLELTDVKMALAKLREKTKAIDQSRDQVPYDETETARYTSNPLETFLEIIEAKIPTPLGTTIKEALTFQYHSTHNLEAYTFSLLIAMCEAVDDLEAIVFDHRDMGDDWRGIKAKKP